MELDAEATYADEDLAGHEYRDECVRQGDSSAEQGEADDHRHETNAHATEELRDQRRPQCHADGPNGDGVLGVRDGGDLVGAELHGTERSQFGGVVQQFELSLFQQGPTVLVFASHGFAPAPGASVEGSGEQEQRDRDGERQPTAGPLQDDQAGHRRHGGALELDQVRRLSGLFDRERQVAAASLPLLTRTRELLSQR